MTLQAFREHEPPMGRQMMMLPFQLMFSWWLDTLLHKPSHTWATRVVERELGWFLSKHGLTIVENGYLDNLLQILLNGKVVTLRGREGKMRLFGGPPPGGFTIGVRPLAANRWHSLADVFPELLDPQADLTWLGVIELVDNYLARLSDAMSAKSLVRKGSSTWLTS